MYDEGAARTAMVDGQVRPSDVTSHEIIDAMLEVPREKFVPASKRVICYADTMVDLGEGRMLLQARIFAKMLQAAAITPTDTVLDIGSGLGYSSAVLSKLANAVIGIEEHEGLASAAETALASSAIDNAVIVTNPLNEGCEAEAPFDVILIEGAVRSVPDAILDQLSEGGRLVAIHMGNDGIGRARMWVHAHGKVTSRDLFEADAPILKGFDAAPAFAF